MYENMISIKRSRSSNYKGREVIVETESDRGRIIFSSAFRRLQQKAQVFPLETNASVRSRLTHSLEVAHTGKYIAQQIVQIMRKDVSKFSESWLEVNEQAFLNVVECACLIHDIGNPPFGHFGEAAICDWFKNRGLEILAGKDDDYKRYIKNEYKDFLTFDGNAQGFRLVSKLQGEDGVSGLNLTYALLGAYLKYARLPQEEDMADKFKKPGYFNTEKTLVKEMRKAVGIKKNKRYALSFIMEAADDIAYCLSDIEDGIEKGLMTEDLFFTELQRLWGIEIGKLDNVDNVDEEYLENLLKDANAMISVGSYIAFKTNLINRLVKYSAEQYCTRHSDVIKGNIDGLIRGECNEQLILKSLRKVVGKHIFKSHVAEGVELAGHSTITKLLDNFSKLLTCTRSQFTELINENDDYIKQNSLDLERRLLNKLSNKSRLVYKKSIEKEALTDVEEWHLRAHMLVDYISGMTDDYALETHQLLAGIKISV